MHLNCKVEMLLAISQSILLNYKPTKACDLSTFTLLITLETNNILTIQQHTEVSNGVRGIPNHHHNNNNIDNNIEVIERARDLFQPFSFVGRSTGLSSFVKALFRGSGCLFCTS